MDSRSGRDPRQEAHTLRSRSASRDPLTGATRPFAWCEGPPVPCYSSARLRVRLRRPRSGRPSRFPESGFADRPDLPALRHQQLNVVPCRSNTPSVTRYVVGYPNFAWKSSSEIWNFVVIVISKPSEIRRVVIFRPVILTVAFSPAIVLAYAIAYRSSNLSTVVSAVSLVRSSGFDGGVRSYGTVDSLQVCADVSGGLVVSETGGLSVAGWPPIWWPVLQPLITTNRLAAITMTSLRRMWSTFGRFGKYFVYLPAELVR